MILSVSKSDIQALDDSKLRELIALLCITELHQHKISHAGVTWGGSQDAPDGGIDVKVDSPQLPNNVGFIPRPITAFQVKKPKMSKTAVSKEMCPNGFLRPAIKDLCSHDGAYIIVSSGSDVSESELQKRRSAMSKAVKESPCYIDFYDAQRICSWVNTYPSLVQWVKSKIGIPIKGWQSFGTWTDSSIAKGKYILSQDLQIKKIKPSSPANDTDIFLGENALIHICELLSLEGKSIRLVGLSGVGKTRFVQALFEIENNKGLSKSSVLYTNLEDAPSPPPVEMIKFYSQQDIRLVLVIDNCSPEMHNKVTTALTKQESKLSLITIEYDVRADLPENTEAYALEPSSNQTIKSFLINRYPKLHRRAIDRITSLSGGNFRIANAFGQALKNNPDISSITDQFLFQKLFQQKNEKNNDLLLAAQALALVYSFDFSRYDSDSEIGILGAFIGFSPKKMYSMVRALEQRQLVQKRTTWRAVLPHGLANRLAEQGLQKIIPDEIIDEFSLDRNSRLLKSMSRRLTYISKNTDAKSISAKWFQKNNQSNDPFNLNRDQMAAFVNFAHLHPEKIVRILEKRVVQIDQSEFNSSLAKNSLQKVLIFIGYEAKYFERVIFLLLRFHSLTNYEQDRETLARRIKTFFQISVSGTHAPIKIRIQTLKRAFLLESKYSIEIALRCLSSGLNASNNLTGHPIFDYELPRNDYGYKPKVLGEVRAWYNTFLDLALELHRNHPKLKKSIEKIIATRLRELWKIQSLPNTIEKIADEIQSTSQWIEGWIATKKFLYLNEKELDEQSIIRLKNIITKLEPTTLIGKIRTFVIDEDGDSFLTLGIEDSKKARNELYQVSRQLGEEVAGSLEVFKELVFELLNAKHPRSIFYFGEGLGSTIKDRDWFLDILFTALSEKKTRVRVPEFFLGYIKTAKQIDSEHIEEMLDRILNSSEIQVFYPHLQSVAFLNERGIKRLITSFKHDTIPAGQYFFLYQHFGALSFDVVMQILDLIAKKSNGQEVCLEMLSFILSEEKNENLRKKFLDLTLSKVKSYNFKFLSNYNNEYYTFKSLVQQCLKSDDTYSTAVIFLEKLLQEFVDSNRFSIPYVFLEIIEVIRKKQPEALLDIIVNNPTKNHHQKLQQLGGFEKICGHISSIDNNLLINWCDHNSPERPLYLLKFITPYPPSNEPFNGDKWIALILAIYTRTPKSIFFSTISNSINRTPSTIISEHLEHFTNLLSALGKLMAQADLDLVQWSKKELEKLESKITEIKLRLEDSSSDVNLYSFE